MLFRQFDSVINFDFLEDEYMTSDDIAGLITALDETYICFCSKDYFHSHEFNQSKKVAPDWKIADFYGGFVQRLNFSFREWETAK